MANYHINSRGNPGICKANEQPCPFGDESLHFRSSETTRKAYEIAMETSKDGDPDKRILRAIHRADRVTKFHGKSHKLISGHLDESNLLSLVFRNQAGTEQETFIRLTTQETE